MPADCWPNSRPQCGTSLYVALYLASPGDRQDRVTSIVERGSRGYDPRGGLHSRLPQLELVAGVRYGVGLGVLSTLLPPGAGTPKLWGLGEAKDRRSSV